MSDHVDEIADTASTTSSSCEDNRIKVVCRVRPPVSRETHGAKTLSLANRCVVVADDKCTVTLNSKPQEKNFTFDYAAGEDSTQEELFAEVGKPVTEACLEGYNGTIFCYGQTGSGKTFTTFGPGAVMENHLNPSDPKSYALRGLVPRVLEYLYANIARQVANGGGKVSYSCKCSFYEIFNEKVFDLVDESNRDNPMGLTVREDTRKGVYVEGLMEEDVDGVDSACEILHRGFRNRHVGETAMNRESSRSHAVFTLIIQATEVVEEEGLTRSRVARFNLVDLAGSERQKDTQASGVRLKEASNINKSLSTLGQVINALVEKSVGRFRHVHYRDSKLTFLLRDSLGGNSKTMLVAALSPADQNFGETLSTLKFAQRAKMIKNQAVKNEDTSGSFDALKREVTTLRQRLAAVQQPGAGGIIPRDIAAGGEQPFPETGEHRDGSADAAATEALLADALRRARSAEESQVGARRRVESLLAALEKGEKDALQLKMIIKFRDGTIAAQRKKDSDQERAALADENAHLLKQLEGGATESAEVSRWRLQTKEAEARLAELTGDKSGDAKRLVWGVGDEERFRGELDEKVLKLMDENRQLTEAADAFEDRLHQETRRAEKRRLSAENRADLEAKKLVENALLSKLQEAQARVEETQAALAASEERAAALETERARQGAAVSALTKQLQDANRREAEAVQDRDVRLADLQSKIGELSQAKERAVKDGGSELASLEVKMVGFIKDNSELLRANKALEEEADGLDRDLEQLEAEKKGLEEKVAAERAEAKSAIESLEGRMQQQQEAHEREFEEQQAEKRSVAEDLETVTKRLRSAEEAHGKEVDEHQRRSNDLQERLVETRAEKAEVEGRLKQLQDDYDTLSDQARFSQSRNQELEIELERSAEALRRAVAAGTARACVAQRQLLATEASLYVTEKALAEAERRAEVEEFFKLAQEAVSARAEAACAERDQQIECLEEELGAARGYADGVRALLVVREEEEDELVEAGGGGWAAGGLDGGKVEAESREAVVDGAVMCRELMGEHESAMERVRGLEQMVDELVGDEDRLVEEVCGLQERIEELQANEDMMTADLASTSAELETAKTDLERAAEKHEAASKALSDQEALSSGLQEELASARSSAAELEAARDKARAVAEEAENKSEELSETLNAVRDSCFEYQARAMTAERSVEDLTADVTRLEDEARAALSREDALLALEKTRAKAALARDRETRATEEALEAARENFDAKSEELAALAEELEEVRREVVAGEERLQEADRARREEAERLQAAEEEVAVGKGTVQGLEREVESLEERVGEAKRELAAAMKEVGAQKKELGSIGRKLAAAEKTVGSVQEALEGAEARAEEAESREAGVRKAAAEAEAESQRDVAAAREELEDVEERLSAEVANRKASEARAVQAETLKTEAEELIASLNQEVARLREDSRSAADRLEESEAVQKVHAGKVIDLKKEVERLQGSMMSEEERESLQSDVEIARLNIKETERMLEVATARNADLEEEIRAMRGETEGYTAKVMELKDVNASLVGHKNSRQKIQQVQKLKDENNLLSRKVKELDDRLFNIKRSGCGPGCGRNAAATTAAPARDADTSATSSWAGSQQSVSPNLKPRSGEGVGSAGKTYNLRRRPKIAEAAQGAGGGGVSTRGRRMGLRDMTNAN